MDWMTGISGIVVLSSIVVAAGIVGGLRREVSAAVSRMESERNRCLA